MRDVTVEFPNLGDGAFDTIRVSDNELEYRVYFKTGEVSWYDYSNAIRFIVDIIGDDYADEIVDFLLVGSVRGKEIPKAYALRTNIICIVSGNK